MFLGADYGIMMSELLPGGYGLIPSAALSGVPAINAKKHMIEDLEDLKKNLCPLGSDAGRAQDKFGTGR